MVLLTNQVGGTRRLNGFPIVGNPSLAAPNIQFDSVNNRFTWVAAPVSALGDIEYLIAREKDTELITEISSIFNTIGTKISRVVPNGKTFFLVKVKLHRTETTVISNGATCTIEVRYDGSVVAILGYQMSKQTITSGTGDGSTIGGGASVDSGIIGVSLVGDGVKPVEVVAVNISQSFRLELQGVELTT